MSRYFDFVAKSTEANRDFAEAMVDVWSAGGTKPPGPRQDGRADVPPASHAPPPSRTATKPRAATKATQGHQGHLTAAIAIMIRGDAQARALGAFIRTQRRLAELSQRELARAADLSDAYVSKLERGMHLPTIGVLRAIGVALNVRADEMLAYCGWLDDLERSAEPGSTEAAISADPRLTPEKKRALLAVYRSLAETLVDTAAVETPAAGADPPAAEDSIASRAT